MINNESITEQNENNIPYLNKYTKIGKSKTDFESITFKKNFYFSCKDCKSTPDIIIVKINNKRALFTCPNCGRAESEKMEKIGNYFSKWIYLLNKDIIYKNLYDNYFTNSYQEAKNSINIKYKLVLTTLELLDKRKNITNGKKIGEMEEKIIKIFDKDLQDLKHLMIFTNILYNTYEIYNIEKYKEIFSEITKFFNNEKFINNINSIKNDCLALLNGLTLDEINSLKQDIEEILQKNKNLDDSSDFIKTKSFIEKSVNFSNNLKNYNKNEIAKNSDNYIDINDILYHVSNQHKIIGSLENNKFVLSLLGKCFEKNGTKIYVSNKENLQLKDVDISSLYSLLLCKNQKKYEINYNYSDKDIENILSNDSKEKFINKNKIMIAKKLNVNNENIILNIGKQNDSLVLYAIILDSDLNKGKNLMNLKGNYHIIEIKEKPLFEDAILYPSLIEEKNIINDSIKEFIGGEKYYPPIGWIEKKLKIIVNQGDSINNINNQEEFAIAYLGLDNYLNDNEYQQKIDELNDYYGNVRKMITKKLYKDDIDIKNNERFCGDGICVFPEPDYAENMAGIIDIYGCIYKIIVMCKINVKKIRQPKTYSYCWILNPTPDEIIPYKILLKEQYCSPLLPNDSFIISYHPENYIIKAIRSKDFSFYHLKKEKRFKFIKESIRNNNDFFVISLYTSVYFGFINEYLRTQNVLESFRKHKGFTEEQLKSWICCLNLALSRNKNVKDFQVTYRAIANYKFPDNINKGDNFYLREFISTSKSKKFCKDWLRDNEGTLLEITIKNNGTNGHANYCFYIDDILTVSSGQEEILISSHCSYTITEIKRGKIDEISLTCEGNLINEISSNYNYTLEIRYKIYDSQNVRIFGEKFVENNSDKCKLIINDNEKNLCSEISIDDNLELEGDNLKIKLILKGDIIDMSYMFCDCDTLLSIYNFSELDTSKATKMNHMFSGCKLLLSLPDISNWDTSNVTTISSMFCGCKLLDSIPDISKWNISKVTDMSYLFSGCESLTSLPDISIWNTNNVIDITSIFENCNILINLPDISKWNTSKVNKMGEIFCNCSFLESVPDISKWDTANVTHISGMFYGCSSLKKIPDISKWNASNIKFKKNMFNECSSLLSVPDITKWNNNK